MSPDNARVFVPVSGPGVVEVIDAASMTNLAGNISVGNGARGIAIAGAAPAPITGYLMGDPSPGKLVPFYRVAPNLATIVGIENTSGNAGPNNTSAQDVTVHVVVFSKRSAEILDFNLCLSPFDFGFIVLQQGAPSGSQLDELSDRGSKVAFLSADADFIPTEGYLTLRAITRHTTRNGSCGTLASPSDFSDGDAEPLATWAILQEVGAGFFATEIPTPTALVNTSTGQATGGTAAFGLIPGPTTVFPNSGDGNMVIARYDINPVNLSQTEVFVWLRRNAFVAPGDPGSGINRSSTISAWLDCEDELEVSTTISLPDEVNIIDPAKLAGINQCKLTDPPQYRGVLRFRMPDTGFVWSQITQEGLNFRMNFLGYNLECNRFIVDWFGGGCP